MYPAAFAILVKRSQGRCLAVLTLFVKDACGEAVIVV